MIRGRLNPRPWSLTSSPPARKWCLSPAANGQRPAGSVVEAVRRSRCNFSTSNIWMAKTEFPWIYCTTAWTKTLLIFGMDFFTQLVVVFFGQVYWIKLVGDECLAEWYSNCIHHGAGTTQRDVESLVDFDVIVNVVVPTNSKERRPCVDCTWLCVMRGIINQSFNLFKRWRGHIYIPTWNLIQAGSLQLYTPPASCRPFLYCCTKCLCNMWTKQLLCSSCLIYQHGSI